MGQDYDYRELQITFTRNIPANLVEMADVVSKIGNLLSEETQISMLPIDTNAEQEKQRKQQEEESKAIPFTFEDVNGN